MITIQQVKALLDTYKIAKQENSELRTILDSNKALKSEANKNEIALLKRILEIQTAIEAMENENKSLKKAVAEEGDLQVVLNGYKVCSDILEEIEEMMSAPKKVDDSVAIAECREALQKVEETKDTLVIPTVCSITKTIKFQAGEKVTALVSALKKPLPLLKKPNLPKPSIKAKTKNVVATVAAVATVAVSGNATPEVKPVKVNEPKVETVTTVEATKVVENTEPQPVTNLSWDDVVNGRKKEPTEILESKYYSGSRISEIH